MEKSRFERAYEALYNAWNNGTLAKGICTACAVGNIVAAGIGATVDSLLNCNKDNDYWSNLFCTDEGGQTIRDTTYVSENNLDMLAERLEKDTGYTEKELAEVEYAFETNTEIKYKDYFKRTQEEIEMDQYNGLMAVMDVLIQLDKVKEGNTYKETFKEKLQTA